MSQVRKHVPKIIAASMLVLATIFLIIIFAAPDVSQKWAASLGLIAGLLIGATYSVYKISDSLINGSAHSGLANLGNNVGGLNTMMSKFGQGEDYDDHEEEHYD